MILMRISMEMIMELIPDMGTAEEY